MSDIWDGLERTSYFSRRFALRRYLDWTTDEIIQSENANWGRAIDHKPVRMIPLSLCGSLFLRKVMKWLVG
jgi:hypothetical protein